MFFQTIFVAVLALVLGLAVCFAGFRLFVVLLPLWALFAGFFGTAQAIQQLFGGGFLATVGSWVFGIVVGVVFAIAAYFFYYAAVVILAATVGYELGVGFMVGLNVSSGFLQFLIGLVLALALSVAVVVFNLPKVFIVALTAVAGAEVILTGILLALGRIPLTELSRGLVGAFIRSSWLWGLVFLAIAVAGVAAQLLTPSMYKVTPYGQGLESFEAPVTAEPTMALPAETPEAIPVPPTSAGPEASAT